jgi:hypothetical protein
MFASEKSHRKNLCLFTCATLTLLTACGGTGGVSTMKNHPSSRIVIPNPSAPSVAAEPGAILVCPSSGKNAWLTYGQNAFFAISESMNLENIEATTPVTKGDVAAFLIHLYGGPAQTSYTDGVIYKSYERLPMTTSQFDYFISSIVVPALDANGVSIADINACFVPALTYPESM